MCGSLSGYSSEMSTFYFCVFAIFSHIARAENINFINTNGWIPVSSETVYEQMKRESALTFSNAASNIQPINTDINKVLPHENNLGKIADDTHTDVDKLKHKCAIYDVANCLNKEINSNSIPKKYPNFVPIVYQQPSIQNYTKDKTDRQAKKIANFNINNYVQQLLLEKESLTKPKDKSYEVTEETDLDDVVEQEQSETEDTGYKYEPLNNQNDNGLFKILSKYKINKHDELPNYALSRRPKTPIPLKLNVPIRPFQNQILGRNNNLNHLPVDPLLAVLLSNYGFYLKGMYGIHNNYNNLYGYLASNNIHNNRPFGFYKIFSDTDSSH